MDELTPAIELAADYARQLRAKQPDHELLRFFADGKDPELDQEFETRFWDKPFPKENKPGHLVNATIWANYAVALKKAVEHQENPASTIAIGEKGIAQVGGTDDCEDGGILRI